MSQNQIAEQIHATGFKCEKTCASKARLVSVLLLPEWLRKWRAFVNQKHEITFDAQLKTALREAEGNKVRRALLHLAECLKSLFSVQS